MDNRLIITPSPHVHSGDSVAKNMYNVLIALLPALLVSLYVFGLSALLVTIISVVACCLTEFIIVKYMMKKTVTLMDGSALLTGVLLAFNLPSNLPIWIIILGAIVAIGIGKMAFGGLGANVFNPALVGRVFLLISFPAQMTTWPVPLKYDGTTGATPLGIIKAAITGSGEAGGNISDAFQIFLGQHGGSLGEVSALALLIGLCWMLYKKTITWHIPVSILATAFVWGGIMHLVNPAIYPAPYIHLITGGMMLGACFMATDYVTSPLAKRAQIIYGCLIGFITVTIRLFGAYPEGMSFAILIMNAATPLLNNYVKPKHFGGKNK